MSFFTFRPLEKSLVVPRNVTIPPILSDLFLILFISSSMEKSFSCIFIVNFFYPPDTGGNIAISSSFFTLVSDVVTSWLSAIIAVLLSKNVFSSGSSFFNCVIISSMVVSSLISISIFSFLVLSLKPAKSFITTIVNA